MRQFFGERGEAGRLERELRTGRPEPRAGFLLALTNHVTATRSRRSRRGSRVAFALALTTFMVGTFASFGGLSYAASGAASAAGVVKQAVASHQARPNRNTSTAQVHGGATAPASNTGGAAAGQAAGVQSSLPFTGMSLLFTVGIGLSLLTAGLILRWRETRQPN